MYGLDHVLSNVEFEYESVMKGKRRLLKRKWRSKGLNLIKNESQGWLDSMLSFKVCSLSQWKVK